MAKNNQAINSKTFGMAKDMLHPSVWVVDAYVHGKWLCLQLSSNVRFMLKNN